MFKKILFPLFALLLFCYASAQESHFSYLDVFDLEYVSDPQIAPDASWIVYRRSGFDIMKDRGKGNLWMIKPDGSQHRKLTSREVSESSARWSPDSQRIAFVSSTDEGAEIYIYWMASGNFARISQLPSSPASLTWSPDGTTLAFTMHVESEPPVLAKSPKKPQGASWADAPRITDRLYHEADGKGYLKPGFHHIFTVPSDGGAVRQISSGDFHHRGKTKLVPQWAKYLLLS